MKSHQTLGPYRYFALPQASVITRDDTFVYLPVGLKAVALDNDHITARFASAPHTTPLIGQLTLAARLSAQSSSLRSRRTKLVAASRPEAIHRSHDGARFRRLHPAEAVVQYGSGLSVYIEAWSAQPLAPPRLENQPGRQADGWRALLAAASQTENELRRLADFARAARTPVDASSLPAIFEDLS